MKVEILKSVERLDEIKKLRVLAYAKSKYSEFINIDSYPNGFSDKLDGRSVHFVIEKQKTIIAAARLTLVHSLSELPYSNIFSDSGIPNIKPFWFFSKMVVSPDYKGLGLRSKIDQKRFEFLNSSEYKTFALMTAKEWRKKELESKGCLEVNMVDFSADTYYPFSNKEKTYILIYNINNDI
ncbi:MAG: hypothetical protein COA32_03765 [Fluviicola sp.]|nr:MAG: hypothetical protein COA32_03765 [Fluviicola sp.]